MASEALKLSLFEIKDNAKAVSNYMDEVISFIGENKKEYDKGLDILCMKNYLFLEYLSNLSYIILKKVAGKSLDGDPAIKRTIANRVYLEKMRSLEQYLRETIDKHLKVSMAVKDNPNISSSSNILSHKPNIDNMIDDEMDNLESGSNQGDHDDGKNLKNSNDGIYVPPKMMAVPYQGTDDDPDFGSASKVKRKMEKSRKDAIKSGLLEELRNQYGDKPEEYRERSDTVRKTIQKEIDHRTQYEEDYMVRVNLSKKEKHKMKLLRSSSHIMDDVTDFRNYKDMMVQAAEEESFKAKSGRGGKKFKRRGGSAGSGLKGKKKQKKRLGKY